MILMVVLQRSNWVPRHFVHCQNRTAPGVVRVTSEFYGPGTDAGLWYYQRLPVHIACASSSKHTRDILVSQLSAYASRHTATSTDISARELLVQIPVLRGWGVF